MRANAIRRFIGDRDGASAVEFSLVALPMFLLLFGIFEYSRLLWTRHVLQQTAIAGARCMSLPQNDCSSEGAYSDDRTLSFVQANAQGLGVALTSSDVFVSRSGSCNGLSGFSQVTVTYTFQTAVPQLIQALAEGVALRETACFPNQA